MKDIFISPATTLKEALKRLDKTAEKTLIIIGSKKQLLGTLTDGDVRRYIIRTGKLTGNIEEIYNKAPIYILYNKRYQTAEIKRIFIERKIEVLPIIDEQNKVIDYLTWAEVFSEKEKSGLDKGEKKIDIPVVIMAGGRGTRLEPFTHVLPKPLIPVGGKTIIEHIIESFKIFGVKNFFITLNYKGEMIEAYFKGIKKDYKIEFIWEKEFLGTAGSLKLLPDTIGDQFFVSNCDVLLRSNFSKIFKFHRYNCSDFTSITAIQHYRIPYGIVNIQNGGIILNITEKPEYTFQINTGVYILNKSVLKYIPKNQLFNMPDLIKILIAQKNKVIAYPVNESEYIDVGQWEDYRKTMNKLGGLESV